MSTFHFRTFHKRLMRFRPWLPPVPSVCSGGKSGSNSGPRPRPAVPSLAWPDLAKYVQKGTKCKGTPLHSTTYFRLSLSLKSTQYSVVCVGLVLVLGKGKQNQKLRFQLSSSMLEWHRDGMGEHYT